MTNVEVLRRDARKRTLCLFVIRSNPIVNERWDMALNSLILMKREGVLSDIDYEYQYCKNLLEYAIVAEMNK